ncbi:hypothetical protein OC844_004048 [Tilletia horrida]|nr:hypothetical protein OC844_004048 [Tilletia horrida]
MSTAAAVVLYDILPNAADADTRQQRPYALLPNPWIARLVLKAKRIPFVVKPITIAQLRASGPGSFWHRLGDALGTGERPQIPMIEHDGRLVGDSLTIADYLDAHFPHSPSAHLPELTSADAAAPAHALAHALAYDAALRLRGLVVSGHVPLAYEQATDRFDEPSRAWLRSDARFGGMRNAYERILAKDKAAALAELRTFLSAYFVVLQPLPLPRIEGLSPSSSSSSSSSSPDDIARLVSRPSDRQQQPRLFLSSRSQPGLLDFILFGWFLFTHTADRALNEAVWAHTSDKARAWLQHHQAGRFALQGEAAEGVGQWEGDVPLPGVEAWVDRMLSLYDNYPRKILNGEIVDGEPAVL